MKTSIKISSVLFFLALISQSLISQQGETYPLIVTAGTEDGNSVIFSGMVICVGQNMMHNAGYNFSNEMNTP